MSSMLEIKDLNVCYGAIHALKGLSLTVGEGELVSLIGANGAGKTTTLHTISGLLPALSGSMTLSGHDLRRVAPNAMIELGLAHVPEGRHVFARMTVEENLRMGAYILRDSQQIQKKPPEGLCPFSTASGAAPAAGRHPLRRRAADAGHRSGTDGGSQDHFDG